MDLRELLLEAADRYAPLDSLRAEPGADET